MRHGILILLVGTAAGFTATGNAPRAPVARRHLVPIVMSEEPVAAPPDRRWLRSLFLGFVAVQSSAALTYEIPGLLGPSPDYFGALIDTGLSIYAVKMLAGQAGLISDVSVDETALAALSDFECSVTLNVGREPNTWMPAEWAASGGRLSLPLKLRFSTEEVDLGVPGEEEMGGRYVRKLYCDGGKFVGAQGEVIVGCTGGGWSSVGKKGSLGETKLRMFLDFPKEAARNDVSLPAGRVYFSSAYLQFDEANRAAELEGAAPGKVLLPPGGKLALLTEGGLTIKRNSARNLWGGLGDIFLILGRFTIGESKVERGDGPETPQEKAERERAEDAARGRRI